MTFLGEPGYALLLDPPGIRQNFHQVDDVLELVCPRLHEAPRWLHIQNSTGLPQWRQRSGIDIWGRLKMLDGPPLNGNLKGEKDDILVNFRGTLFSDQSIFSLIYQLFYNKTRANRSALWRNQTRQPFVKLAYWIGAVAVYPAASRSWPCSRCHGGCIVRGPVRQIVKSRVATSILYVSFPSSYNYGTCIYRNEGSACPLVTYFLTQRSVARDKWKKNRPPCLWYLRVRRRTRLLRRFFVSWICRKLRAKKLSLALLTRTKCE